MLVFGKHCNKERYLKQKHPTTSNDVLIYIFI